MSEQRYCTTCRRQVLAVRKQRGFWVSAIMTFMTCGIWLVVPKPKNYRCPICGTEHLQAAVVFDRPRS